MFEFDAEAKVAIILLAYDPVWSLLIIGTGCTLGRAPCTKETLPDFREWSRVTRHSRVFHGLTGCQRTPPPPPVLGRHSLVSQHRYMTT